MVESRTGEIYIVTMDEYIFSASDLINHLKTHAKLAIQSLPKSALLCLSPSIAVQLAKNLNWRVESALGARWAFAVEPLVTVSGFGMGAPACAAKIEEMAALGVKRLIFVGTAGSLQSNLRAGDVVIVEKAISNEGTSKHYGKQTDFTADEALFKEISSGFRQKGIVFQSGTTITTDAPYRETRAMLNKMSNSGVLTIDMEASAIFAAARAVGIAAVGVFVISDELFDGRWSPHFGKSHLRDKFVSTAGFLVQLLSRSKKNDL